MIYYNKKGLLHRVNAPASIWETGDFVWYNNGKRHRYYGPAVRWGCESYYWILGVKMI